ncbi:MAG: cytochrome c [Deltaproteobacteria bacterium]|nr:cytochrome c [Deltaproteobacteria bacterium]
MAKRDFSTGWAVAAVVLAVAAAACGGDPMLGTDPTAVTPKELTDLRKAEVVKLGSYQWANQGAGVVRVPTHRAMDLVLKDWKARPTEPVDVERKVVIPAAPAAGTAPEDAAAALARAGAQVFAVKACIACHETGTGPQKAGPNFKGMFGRVEEMADGTKVTIDEAYIKESLLTPMAKVVKGFAPVMPPQVVTDDEFRALIAYLKTL